MLIFEPRWATPSLVPGPSHTAPPRVRRSDFQRTRERIVAAARRQMAERGPESLTVSAVAHAAGIHRTTAYQHFRTRDDLVRFVMQELIAEVGRLLAEPRPLPERIDFLAGYFLEHPEVARLALHLLLSETPLPAEGWKQAVDEARRLAEGEGGQEGVDPEMLVHVLMAVGILWPLHARIEYENPRAARQATARMTRELKRLLLYGVLRPAAWPELVASIRRNS